MPVTGKIAVRLCLCLRQCVFATSSLSISVVLFVLFLFVSVVVGTKSLYCCGPGCAYTKSGAAIYDLFEKSIVNVAQSYTKRHGCAAFTSRRSVWCTHQGGGPWPSAPPGGETK